MTNIQKISKEDVNRLENLYNRREKLIQANYINDYIRSNKAKRYLHLLSMIRTEIIKRQVSNRIKWKETDAHKFLMTSKGLSGSQILIHS